FFEDGRFEQAIAFEQSCHERRDVFPWSLLCAYDARKLIPERHAAAFWDVLRNHSHLIPAGELGVALELFPDGAGPCAPSAGRSRRSRCGRVTKRIGTLSRWPSAA